MAAKQVEVQWLEGWLRLLVGPSAESVRVAEQALTSAPCLKYNSVRVVKLTCCEAARALQVLLSIYLFHIIYLSNEQSNVENGAGSRPGHAKMQGTG